jgi:hypothetical protein
VLELRCDGELTEEKRRSLRRVQRVDESLSASLWLAARGLRNVGRTSETLGAENLLLKAVLWKKTLGFREGHNAGASRNGHQSAATPAAALHTNGKKSAAPRPGAMPEPIAQTFRQIQVARQKIAPLSLAVSAAAPRRVNLLIPETKPRAPPERGGPPRAPCHR